MKIPDKTRKVFSAGLEFVSIGNITPQPIPAIKGKSNKTKGISPLCAAIMIHKSKKAILVKQLAYMVKL